MPVIKFFTVFHASQIEGIEPFSPKKFNNVIDSQEAEKIILNSGAKIRHSGFSAFYSPLDDFIQAPKKNFLSTLQATTPWYFMNFLTGQDIPQDSTEIYQYWELQ